jgi:transitional endoplasmic reticulum ATPase
LRSVPGQSIMAEAQPQTETAKPTLKPKVAEALAKDLGRGFARLDPSDMAKLGLETGEVVEIVGKRKTVAKLMPTYTAHRGLARLRIDGVTRENAGTALDQVVELRKVQSEPAERVVLAPLTLTPTERDLRYFGTVLNGLPVLVGDRVRASLFGNRAAEFKIVATAPEGAVVISPATVLEIGQETAKPGELSRPVSYEEIGGLKRELHRIREIVELPLRSPEVFERLGIDAPKGVLLHGPPGCGKTLIARAVAHETQAHFFSVNGPEIIHRHYGESEAQLRKVFEEAERQAPSIIFLDEIDAIAPSREQVFGEVEKRVVAQLLALMDGLAQRSHVVVIAATNLPNVLDPALRRPGRFDREIAISVPDREARQEILEVHSRGMPLSADVEMNHIAAITHGFVGADLAALCREAAMTCLRRVLPEVNYDAGQIPYESLARLEVRMADFIDALREVEPSAIREVFVELPDIHWHDVGGLEAIKQQLIEAVEWPLKHAALFADAGIRPPKGLLLSGPPGCGKTLLAKAVASETQANFLSVKGPALMSKYVGESERGVREVFRKARQAAPCIVFFDEIDALLPTRGSGGSDAHVTERIIGQFLAEMDGVEELNGVFILGATNRPDLLDPALLRPGRFDLLIQVPPPDLAGRHEIFLIAVRDKPLARDADLDELAALTEGFNGAEIQAVCRQAALAALRDVIQAAPKVPRIMITRDQLIKAVGEIAARHDSRS